MQSSSGDGGGDQNGGGETYRSIPDYTFPDFGNGGWRTDDGSADASFDFTAQVRGGIVKARQSFFSKTICCCCGGWTRSNVVWSVKGKKKLLN